MFGMGWPEIAVILVVALLVFGPDKLPEIAKQAGRGIRTVRQMAENAKNDLGREMGQDLSDLDLASLDPREVVRRTFLDDEASPTKPRLNPDVALPSVLPVGARPPFDDEAT
ncbi:sec-independent translocase [Aeromicrobium sp. IC_218]|uniref:sec-independent translocase n=1 Tax=Aeromicrobium sp. IC_218 TaxID=2545468 RepID=UPI00103EFB15|nr:sec-independent translocase [Aeromicrobium sp. IC_218]TCI98892.1 twin-arginine translocase subunit TatB [Aeromicrobium sp. IC_218]